MLKPVCTARTSTITVANADLASNFFFKIDQYLVLLTVAMTKTRRLTFRTTLYMCMFERHKYEPLY